MTVIPFIDIIERLESDGFTNIKISSLKGILLFYELGSLRQGEYRDIMKISQEFAGNHINSLYGMGILVRRGKGIKYSPFEYKLNPLVRKIIEGTYEKRDDSNAA